MDKKQIITSKKSITEGYRGNGAQTPTPTKLTPMPQIKPAPHLPKK